MKKKQIGLSLAIACLIGASAPAAAGGFGADAGGLKRSIYEGVPVPAPSPIPVYEAKWYIRADFGYALSSDMGTSTTGFGFTPYGTIDGQMDLTLGMGRYLTGSLRAELAIDIRNEENLGKYNQSYVGSVSVAAIAPATGTDTHSFNVTRNDRVRLASYTGMANLYYDFNNRSRFTPYVGGGAGIAIHTMTRRYNESSTCVSTTNSVTATTTACTDSAPTYANVSGTSARTGYGVAANAMVGFAYDLGDDWLLDVNYRFSWMGGKVKLVGSSLGGSSTVEIGDVTEHALRVGARMNIN